MYIFDKTITQFTKEIMFVLWFHFLLSGSIYTIRTMTVLSSLLFPLVCQHYNNYYTIFYIQQVINKLKVISADCVVKEQV